MSNKPSRAVRAEAALWLAHLRSPERDADVEQGLRLWLQAKPEHTLAFEQATEVWERVGAVRRHPHEVARKAMGVTDRRGRRVWALAAAVTAVAVGVTFWYSQRNTVATAIGEQRTLTLSDGTRVFLNTDTRAVIQYDDEERLVRLDKGEVLFEVARQPARPFAVIAGEARVEALGTSFVVRRDAQQLTVTLVDGKVSVAVQASQPARILNSGERLTIAARQQPALDKPALDKLTAWQQGQVAFDNVPLGEAVAEMNRYSTVKLAIENPQAAHVQIGGIFRTGDIASFAQAMVATYRLRIVQEEGRTVLAGMPEVPQH